MRIAGERRTVHMRLDVFLVIIGWMHFSRQAIMHHQILVIRIDGIHIAFVDQNTWPDFWTEDLFGAHFQDRPNVQATPVELLWRNTAQDIHPGDHLLHALHARLVSRTAPAEEVPLVEGLYRNVLLLCTSADFAHRNDRNFFCSELSVEFEH